MSVVQGKNKIMVLLLICLFTAILCQLMGMTAVMAVMFMLIQTLDDESDLSQSRMIFVAAAMICAWFGRFPIGMGAALPLTTNAYYEGLVEGNSEYLIGMFDFLKVGFFPSICLTVYTIAAWKLIPKQEVNASAVSSVGVGGQRNAAPSISSFQEKVIFLVFLGVMLAFFFSGSLGSLIYIIPAAGVLVLIIFCSACLAIAFPTGCAAATMAFSIGNHNPMKTLKFCIPYLIIGMASTIASAMFFYPVYG